MMDRFFRKFRTSLALLTLLACALPAQAQFGAMKLNGVNAAFFKLFGSNTNFSAEVDAQVLDKNGKDWVRAPLSLAAQGEKMVMDIDLSKAVSRDFPEITKDSLVAAGMHKVRSIVRSDKLATFLIYPGAQSYLNLPLSAEEAASLRKGFKVQTTPMGKETLEGKERTKNRVIIRDSAGVPVLDAFTWTAPELKHFPFKIESRQEDFTVVLRFRDVVFARPSPAVFDVPAGYTEYTNVQRMMFSVMTKIATGATGLREK